MDLIAETKPAMLELARTYYKFLNSSEMPVTDLRFILGTLRDFRFSFIDLTSDQPEIIAERKQARLLIKEKIRHDFRQAVTARVGSFDIPACEKLEKRDCLDYRQRMIELNSRMAQFDLGSPNL